MTPFHRAWGDSGRYADDPALVARIAAANVVYLSGGKPGFLLNTLRGSHAWDAVHEVYARDRGLAGCSAGAMILGAKLTAPALRLALVPRRRVRPSAGHDHLPPL
jgi:cyanophycinase-like exopeptidase